MQYTITITVIYSIHSESYEARMTVEADTLEDAIAQAHAHIQGRVIGSPIFHVERVQGFSAWMRARRAELDITQAELAELVGTSQGRIGDYERGAVDPGLSTLRKICAVLGPYTLAPEGECDE